jgi:hypothetical protein
VLQTRLLGRRLNDNALKAAPVGELRRTFDFYEHAEIQKQKGSTTFVIEPLSDFAVQKQYSYIKSMTA